MRPAYRRALLLTHIVSSLGWIGSVLAYLVLAVAATQDDGQVVRAAWVAMDLTGWFAIVPLAVASLLTGVLISSTTRWGLLRHYWVVISLALTVLCTGFLVFHMPSVSEMAEDARVNSDQQLVGIGSDLMHPAVGLFLLLVVAVLNTYKPRGLTRYGQRRAWSGRSASRAVPARSGQQRAPVD